MVLQALAIQVVFMFKELCAMLQSIVNKAAYSVGTAVNVLMLLITTHDNVNVMCQIFGSGREETASYCRDPRALHSVHRISMSQHFVSVCIVS